MTTKSKQLVRAGHELASELKADCGAVDMRSVANLLTELASALDVQSARSEALAAENVVIIDLARTFADRADEYKSSMFGYSVSESVDELNHAGSKELTDAENPNTDAWVNEQRAAGRVEGVNDACAAAGINLTVEG